MATITLSAFLRSPNEVIARLDDGDVVLTRRQGESLRLSRESDRSAEYAMVSALTQLISGLTPREEWVALGAILQSGPFPWLEFLTDDGRREFVAQYLRTARACAELQRFEPLAVMVGNWRETAVAHALGLDQELESAEYLDEPIPAPRPSRHGS